MMISRILAFLFLSQIAAASSHAVCVLNYEFAQHPYSQKIRAIFQNIPQAKLVEEAVPTDFLTCAKEGYEEIIIIAHAGGIGTEGKAMLAFINRTDDGRAKPVPFLPRVFLQTREYFWKLKAQNQPIPLKRIRLVSCLNEQLLYTYWDLRALSIEYNIPIDVAPKQEMMSLLKGKSVVALDTAWLGESAQFKDPNNPNDSFYVYMNLKTLGVTRFGTRTGLRGKYTVSVEGAALGLANKWSTVFINYRDVDNLAPGETTKLFVPHLDIALAFWANVEIGASPIPKLQLTHEINSLGVSAGLFSKIAVTRNY